MDFFIIFAICSFVVCLAAFVYIQYAEGNDLQLRDLFAVLLCASVPGVNLLILISIISNSPQFDTVLLKGKNRNDA